MRVVFLCLCLFASAPSIWLTNAWQPPLTRTFPKTTFQKSGTALLAEEAASEEESTAAISGSQSFDPPSEEQVLLAENIPEDDSYSRNPLKRMRALFTSTAVNAEKGREHDRFLRRSGGIWKTKAFGFIDVYAASSVAPDVTKELAVAEGRGQLRNSWPSSVITVLGPNSLIAADDAKDAGFRSARKVYADSLSLKTLLHQSSSSSSSSSLLSVIEQEVQEAVSTWEEAAIHNRTTVFADTISATTFNIIVKAIFGGDIDDEQVAVVRSCTDSIAKGLFAFPLDNVLVRRIPFLNRYSRAMQARTTMAKLVETIVQKKRMYAVEIDRDESRPESMLDSLLSNAELPESEIVDFCCDNVILSVFAGFDTTASVTTNLVLILSDDMQARDALRAELERFDCHSIPTDVTEVFELLPTLKSAVHESFRFRPVIGASFRKTVTDTRIGRVVVPANQTLTWNNLAGMRSETLYTQPHKACPLRFVQRPDESLPFIFGYGKHRCPGQYLAQLEM